MLSGVVDRYFDANIFYPATRTLALSEHLFGIARPAPVPAVYRLLAGLPRGVVVSLPTWVETPVPMFEADYQLFSTVHWMPIVNGYSRFSRPGYAETMRQLSTFPSIESARRMRQLGVRYVVFHANRYNRDLRAVASAAKRSSAFELLAEDGDETLWRQRGSTRWSAVGR